jgi:hypothetical protein
MRLLRSTGMYFSEIHGKIRNEEPKRIYPRHVHYPQQRLQFLRPQIPACRRRKYLSESILSNMMRSLDYKNESIELRSVLDLGKCKDDKFRDMSHFYAHHTLRRIAFYSVP